MALVRWQPYREMQDVRREMNRLFEDMLAPSGRGDGMSIAFAPPAELEETEDSYKVKLELPGMEPEDIDIDVMAEAISIKGERKTEKKEEDEGMTRSEFRYGRFQRVIPLPGRIDNQNASAECKNGVLQVTLPKSEEEKHKVVKVNVGS